MFVVVNELGSITDNDEYMLHLWVWNEGTMGLPVVRFPRFPDNESVEQTTAWAFPAWSLIKRPFLGSRFVVVVILF